MPWDLAAYWVCFGLGSVYALVSAVLTGFFGFMGHGGDAAPASFDVHSEFGVDGTAGGHGDAFSVESGGEPIIAPISPATIAVFLTTFGGMGIILRTLFGFTLVKSLPISALAGFLVAFAVFTLFYKLSVAIQASSEPRMAETIGLHGEVTVPIPHDGVGEIAFICRGLRLSSTARSQDQIDIPRHASVKIVRQVGNTAYVSILTRDESKPQPPGVSPQDFRD